MGLVILRVDQVQLGAVDGRFVGRNRSFVLPKRCLLRVQVLLGNHAAGVKRLHSLELRLGILELRFVALQIGFGSRQRNLVRTRVDLDQQLPLRNVLAFLEIDLRDLSIDAGLQATLY